MRLDAVVHQIFSDRETDSVIRLYTDRGGLGHGEINIGWWDYEIATTSGIKCCWGALLEALHDRAFTVVQNLHGRKNR